MKRTRAKPGAVLTLVCAGVGLSLPVTAQDLTPRAYLITPVRTTTLVMTFSSSSGEVLLDPTLPIKDLNARLRVPILSVYRSFNFFSRSANIVASLPYGFGHFEGLVLGSAAEASRSGLADARVRVAVNLRGGPAMKLGEYIKYRERTVLGASMTMVVPVGQYDPARLINLGANRWALKPEVGFARRFGPWALDAYGGVWLFSTNSRFYPGESVRKQNPIGAVEAHLGYYIRPRIWTSFDVNYWSGGSTVMNGVSNEDAARNSRVGGTFAAPITRSQTFKFSASRGAIVRVGGNFTTLTAAWQYTWIDQGR